MNLSGFIDLHTHLLPGIDDGCADIGNALSTARQYTERGYSTIVVTPHHIHGTAWSADAERIQQLTTKLQREITNNRIPLKLHTGMEIAFSELFWLHFQQGRFLPLGGSKTYLLEFPLQGSGRKNIDIFLDGITAGDGSKFLLAHPERCVAFQEDLRNLQLLFERGCLLQLNFGSILGWYGRKSQKTALSILTNGMCHLIATDCHGHGKRRLPEPVHFRELEELIGQKHAAAALRNNPLSILNDLDILPIRPVLGRIETIIEDNERNKDISPKKRGSILSRMVNLFRRNSR